MYVKLTFPQISLTIDVSQLRLFQVVEVVEVHSEVEVFGEFVEGHYLLLWVVVHDAEEGSLHHLLTLQTPIVNSFPPGKCDVQIGKLYHEQIIQL